MLATEISPSRTATNARNIFPFMMKLTLDEEFESPAQEVDVRRENKSENIQGDFTLEPEALSGAGVRLLLPLQP